jgi:tetratricopeptide (TPR) repeat protein
VPPTRPRTRQRSPAPVSESLQGLGELLRKARTDAGLSQAQLGAPHFTRAYVSALELGKIRPAMSSLEFLAGRLGKAPSYFLDDAEQERKRAERALDVKAAAALLARPTAADALRRVEDLIGTATEPSDIGRLRLMAGTALNFLFRGADALRELTAADRLTSPMADTRLRQAIAHQTAIALRLIGEHDRARETLVALLSETERSDPKNRILRTRLLRDLGAVSWDLGEHEKASAYYQSALEWAKDIGDLAGLIAIYNGLGYAQRSLGDLEGATAYLQKALAATEVANDLATAALVHNALAVIAAERGHLDAAYRHVDKAIEIARVHGPESYVAHYMTTKAECALKSNELTDAREVATDALALADRTGNHRAAAAARVVLGEVASHGGLHQEARQRLEEAAGIYRELGAKQELGDVLIRLSEDAKEQGQSELSQRYAQEAYEATRTESGLVRRRK